MSTTKKWSAGILCWGLVAVVSGQAAASSPWFDDFDGPDIDPAWVMGTNNLADWESHFADSALHITSLTQNAQSQSNNTTVTLVRSFDPLGNFHGQLIQSWVQNSVEERPILSFRLSSDTLDISFGLEDKSGEDWGIYFADSGPRVTQAAPASGTATWSFVRIDDTFSIYLNGDSEPFHTVEVDPQMVFHTARVYISGFQMNSSDWTWTGTQSLEYIGVIPEPSSAALLLGGSLLLLRPIKR